VTARGVVLSALLLAARATAVSAQTPAPPAEPATPARVQLGPFSLRPTLILRDVGYDSNVFNEAADPKHDFTATVGAKLDVNARLTRIQGTYSTFYEYMYFNTYHSERGSNRGAEGRFDLLFGRLRPYFAAGITSSNDRPTAEIDERAHRRQDNLGGGLNVAVFSRTTLNVGYRRSSVEYASDEEFRGVSLADELNGHSDALTFGGDMELSPLTSIGVAGERLEERFDSSSERDADSYRVAGTVTLQPLALISGRASVGVRAFRPLSPVLRDFTGLVAGVAVGYSFPGEARLNVTFDRDLRYSFEQLTPYYISTAGRVTLTKRLFGNLDAQVFAGAEQIAYEARLDAPTVSDTDNVRTYGGGIGYRVGDGGRLALNFDGTERSSPAVDREYSRGRIYTTVTYGF
jgi:Putative beta-barrel porin 2